MAIVLLHSIPLFELVGTLRWSFWAAALEHRTLGSLKEVVVMHWALFSLHWVHSTTLAVL